MSSDLSQLIHLLGQNTQILSVSGTANQTTSELSQGIVSSGGPNASQRLQVANANINNVTYNFHFTGDSIRSASRVIANEDHGAYPNHQSTVTSYERPSMIEAADQGDLNAKLAAIKESTVGVRKSTEELKATTVKLAETTAKLSERVAALNWPTFKLSLDSEAEVALGDLTLKQCLGLDRIGQPIVELGQSCVEYGESTVRDSGSIISMMTVGESISLDVFDALTSKLGEVAARFRESHASFYRQALSCNRSDPDFDKRPRQLRDFVMYKEMTTEVTESIDTTVASLAAFFESMVAYAKSLGAPDDLIAAFKPQDQ